jgi:hypothetical protein
MRKRTALLLTLLLVLATIPRLASAAPEKFTGPLEVTYYYLPT